EIEALGRSVTATAEEPAAAGEPGEIRPRWEIVPHPEQEHQQDADGEGNAEIVMGIFAPLRQRRECLRADERHQQFFAEHDVQTGQPEDDEADRREPVNEALAAVETQDANSGPAALQANAAAQQIEE